MEGKHGAVPTDRTRYQPENSIETHSSTMLVRSSWKLPVFRQDGGPPYQPAHIEKQNNRRQPAQFPVLMKHKFSIRFISSSTHLIFLSGNDETRDTINLS